MNILGTIPEIIDIILFASTLSSLIMIVGSFRLLRFGVISLQQSGGANTSLKLGEFIQFGTTVPALGLFLIGVVFMILSLHYGMQRVASAEEVSERVEQTLADSKVSLRGLIKTDEPTSLIVSVCLGSTYQIASDKFFDISIDPVPNFYEVQISGPGYNPQIWSIARVSGGIPEYAKVYKNLRVPDKGFVDLQEISMAQVAVIPSKTVIVKDTDFPTPADPSASYYK